MSHFVDGRCDECEEPAIVGLSGRRLCLYCFKQELEKMAAAMANLERLYRRNQKVPVNKAKLGMKVEVPKKPVPTPYDELSDKMLKGQKEQAALEKQGSRKVVRTGFEEEIVRSQAKIPKVKPAVPTKDPTDI